VKRTFTYVEAKLSLRPLKRGDVLPVPTGL